MLGHRASLVCYARGIISFSRPLREEEKRRRTMTEVEGKGNSCDSPGQHHPNRPKLSPFSSITYHRSFQLFACVEYSSLEDKIYPPPLFFCSIICRMHFLDSLFITLLLSRFLLSDWSSDDRYSKFAIIESIINTERRKCNTWSNNPSIVICTEFLFSYFSPRVNKIHYTLTPSCSEITARRNVQNVPWSLLKRVSFQFAEFLLSLRLSPSTSPRRLLPSITSSSICHARNVVSFFDALSLSLGPLWTRGRTREKRKREEKRRNGPHVHEAEKGDEIRTK